MAFTCNHNGITHQHELVYEARVCWGFIRPVQTAPVRPYEVHEPPVRRPSDAQLKYIVDLGGDLAYAKTLTGGKDGSASKYIEQLIAKKGSAVSSPTLVTPRPKDPRLAMLAGLLPSVRDGYYATQEEAGSKINFLRISTPKRVTRQPLSKALRKIQTQHGPRWEPEGGLWPSGELTIYRSQVTDMMMLLVADPIGCLMRYAKELDHCCKCNTELTDARSRHYGIGPDCEKLWPWVLNLIDEKNDGKTFEQLAR